ncbi:hypothetical protein [Psychrobacter aestuarii]|uniref:Uncharacterized protein n=1 Tax=Psychrobacter aestuarii TaxID=556327 RepID=A0ABN0VLU1_9GAMM|nr:hypothetical protein [Psychrobacter aestuarii]
MTHHTDNAENMDKEPLNSTVNKQVTNPKDSYEGRKYEPEIDGPEQDSQETDEVYADPRRAENLPEGGKDVADLNAYDLSKEQNQPK